MKKAALFLLVATALVSCEKKYSGNDYSKLNGYWEIEEVQMPDGSEKDYTINPTVDHFELKDTVGTRTKVMPQLDGTYRTNDLKDNFSVRKEDGKTMLYYSTEFAKWKEELITLSDDEFVVKNEANIEYHYKRPKPFSVK